MKRTSTAFTPVFILAFILGSPTLGTTLSTTAALADSLESMEAECHKQLKLGDAGCECIADRADDLLNEKQRELIVAMVTKDQAAADALQSQLTPEEQGNAATFMMTAPQICANP